MSSGVKTVQLPATPNKKAVTLAFETFGSPSNPALLLIMGLGGQLIAWPQDFCEQLAARGLFVIIFDNRDIGLSTSFDDEFSGEDIKAAHIAFAHIKANPELAKTLTTRLTAFTLGDMAADCIGLLDHLGIAKAHVAGASMGGMIVQKLYIDFPTRLLSVVSIMSTTGETDLGPEGEADPHALKELMAVAQSRSTTTSRDELIELGVRAAKALAGPLFDEEEARRKEIAYFERSFRPNGIARQLLAIMSRKPTREDLRRVSKEHHLPSVVIHGKADRLIPLKCGEDTAAAIEGSKLVVIEELGHDFPTPLLGKFADAICLATHPTAHF